MEADDLTGGSDHLGAGGAAVGLVGVGIDLVEVPRMAAALTRTPALAVRLFTEGERRWCTAGARPEQRYAARFAAKEAAMKALGVGLGAIGWHDIEVTRADSGAPSLVVSGRAAALAAERGGKTWLVSLSHTVTVAEAIVLLRA